MDHTHHAPDARKNNPILPLKIGFIAAFIFFATELLVSVFSSSIAVLGDSLHNLSHVFVFAFSLVGFWLAQKPPSTKITYGLKRLETLMSRQCGFSGNDRPLAYYGRKISNPVAPDCGWNADNNRGLARYCGRYCGCSVDKKASEKSHRNNPIDAFIF